MNNPNKIAFFSFIFLLFFVLSRFNFEIHIALAKDVSKSFFFNKYLKTGDRNEDVRNLQKILNKNSTTKISSFGSGSSGNETDFFGELTKSRYKISRIARFRDFISIRSKIRHRFCRCRDQIKIQFFDGKR